MKASKHNEVIEELEDNLEASNVPGDKAPVRVCHRYLFNRKDQLNYQRAGDLDLPIGSGKIEGSHRFVIQKRLKLPGSWWLIETANHMLTLRTVRANNQWDSYWARIWGEKKLKYAA